MCLIWSEWTMALMLMSTMLIGQWSRMNSITRLMQQLEIIDSPSLGG